MSYIDAGYALILAVVAGYGALLLGRRRRAERMTDVAGRGGSQ